MLGATVLLFAATNLSATPMVDAVADIIFYDEFEPVSFRLDTLDLRDPHFFTNVGICLDITDSGATSVNGAASTAITTDGNGDGFLDLSYLPRFATFDQTDGASGNMELDGGDCRTPYPPVSCTANAVSLLAATYTSHQNDVCLTTVPQSTHGYTPAVADASAPCFVTAPSSLPIALAGVTLTLQNAQIAATFANNGRDHLVNGLLSGFLTQADADNITIPNNVLLIGGQKLSKQLPGGTGSCKNGTLSTFNSAPGWWFYFNFTATHTPYLP